MSTVEQDNPDGFDAQQILSLGKLKRGETLTPPQQSIANQEDILAKLHETRVRAKIQSKQPLSTIKDVGDYSFTTAAEAGGKLW